MSLDLVSCLQILLYVNTFNTLYLFKVLRPRNDEPCYIYDFSKVDIGCERFCLYSSHNDNCISM